MAMGLGSGLLVAACGAFVQADRIRLAGVLVPYGLALAVATALIWQLWLGGRTGQRLATVAFAVAWVVTTLGIGTGRVGQGVVLAAEVRVTWYLGLGALAVALGASLPVIRGRAAADSSVAGQASDAVAAP